MSGSKPSLADLEKRVSGLEKRFYAAGAIAVILAGAGGFLWTELQSAQQQIESLQAKAQAFKATEDQELSAFKLRLGDIEQASLVPLVVSRVNEEESRRLHAEAVIAHWVSVIYAEAQGNPVPRGHDANGWWEQNLINLNSQAQAQLTTLK